MLFSTFLYRAFTAHFDLDVRLVHAPTAPHGTLPAVARLFQLGTVCDDPALDGRMIDRDTPFFNQLFDMPIAQRVGHIPAHAHENDVLGKMGPLEADRHLVALPRCAP